MNADRRKALKVQLERVDVELRRAVSDAMASIERAAELAAEIVADVEAIRDEEQEACDALPESLQDGERGNAMQAAIESMEEALSLLQDWADLEAPAAADVDSIVTALDTARE